MSVYTTKKWVVKTPYNGHPKREDLEIVEEELPPLKDGGRSHNKNPAILGVGHL